MTLVHPMPRVLGLVLLLVPAFPASSCTAQDPAPAAPIRAVRLRTAAEGPFTELRVGSTTLRAAPQHANLDGGRGVDGWHCLHICRWDEDGTARVTVHFDPPVQRPHRVRFGAERWTRHEPFRCAVRAVGVGEAEERSFDLADRVRVGRVFPSQVELDVDGLAALQSLEFEVTAPRGTGLLVDDILVEPRGPRRVVGAPEVVTATTPVLLGADDNPLAAVRLDVAGTDGELAVTAVQVDLSAVDSFDDLDLLAVDVVPEAAGVGPTRLAALTDFAAREWTATGSVALTGGPVTLRVVASCSAAASLDRRIGARITAVELGDGSRLTVPSAGPRWQRIGLPLRLAGQDGVHTTRIPGLATTTKGSLLAVFDLRHDSGRDLPGDVDVGLRRSTDGGRTWSRTQAILDMGEPQARNGVGDPCILVDELSGRVWVFALWSCGERAWHGSGPGLDPVDTGQLVCTTSDDDGLTWSAPRNLTRDLKDPEWRLFFNGPGRGITTWDGTLVVPAQFRDASGVPHSTVIWSDDRGATWQVGTGARSNTTEAQVVELVDGRWMLNCRDDRGGSRAVLVTADRGRTWSEHPTSRSALPEPVCMASLLRVPWGPRGLEGDLLAFSNPAVPAAPRRDLTLKLSRDDGASWPATMHLRIDDLRSAGYSCLTVIDERTLGILYEGGRAQLVFQRIPLSAVLVE